MFYKHVAYGGKGAKTVFADVPQGDAVCKMAVYIGQQPAVEGALGIVGAVAFGKRLKV